MRTLLCLLVLSVCAVAQEHKFWDKTNVALHVTNAAVQVTDLTLTRYNIDHRKAEEVNPLMKPWTNRGWPGSVASFIGINTGVTLLGSYIAHRSGHHKIERWIPVWTIGGGVYGISYTLKNW